MKCTYVVVEKKLAILYMHANCMQWATICIYFRRDCYTLVEMAFWGVYMHSCDLFSTRYGRSYEGERKIRQVLTIKVSRH
jgi:hypothetical protein